MLKNIESRKNSENNDEVRYDLPLNTAQSPNIDKRFGNERSLP